MLQYFAEELVNIMLVSSLVIVSHVSKVNKDSFGTFEMLKF